MTALVHHRFLAIAPDLSSALHDALHRLGPVELPVRDHIAFPEHLARAVAGQQLSVKAARSIWSRVEAACADAPLIEAFCEGRAEELRDCGLSNAKVKTLLAIGQAARDGRLDGEALRALSPAERAAELTALWGVGQWTADMANIFWFGEQDIWPDGDVAARKTLERLTSPRRKTVRTAERFAPYRSYLALYMWRWVDARPD
jgi:DNA-3-methyladenine glycosylase II